MALADQFLIYTLTIISIVITVKSSKTGIYELIRFLRWTIFKVKQIFYMIFPNRKPPTSETKIGKIWERSKATLLPFISRDYYKKIRRKRIVGIFYFFIFLIGISLIYFLFWSFLTADLEYVVNNSPYLLESIKSLILAYQFLSKTFSVLFIIGFIIETINSLRSLF